LTKDGVVGNRRNNEEDVSYLVLTGLAINEDFEHVVVVVESCGLVEAWMISCQNKCASFFIPILIFALLVY